MGGNYLENNLATVSVVVAQAVPTVAGLLGLLTTGPVTTGPVDYWA